jgi:hypothetical protein
VASVVFLCGGAFVFNLIINSNETLSKNSFFPAFLFVLLSSEAFSSYSFHPALAANVLVVLAMMRMMKSYRMDDSKSLFFDGAFLISAASLIYFPAITLLPLVFICLIILRPFIWREWAMAFLGMAGPHVLVASVMYVLGRLDHYYNKGMFVGFDFRAFQPAFASQYFVLFCLAFLFVLLIFKRLSGGASRKIRQQKNINILGFWLLLGVGGIFYENPYRTSIPLLCVPPMAGILSEWLGNFRRSTLSDFALMLLLAAFTLSVLQIQGVM